MSRTGAEDRNVPSFRALLERQKAYFATDATKPYDWRIDQLGEADPNAVGEREAVLGRIEECFVKAWMCAVVFANSVGMYCRKSAIRRQQPTPTACSEFR